MELDKIKSLAILGDCDTGKTNLAISHLREYKGDRTIYLLGYPKKIDNFKNLSSFKDLFHITDSIIFLDEISRFIKVYDRKANVELMELISVFEHQNNTIIFTTQLSQFITKGVEAFIDCWNMTRIDDLETLKNGSKPKRIIKDTVHPKCSKWSLMLNRGEYLEFSERNRIGENGVKTFSNQEVGKDWRSGNSERNSEKNVQKTATKNK